MDKKEAFQLPLYQLFKKFQRYDNSLKHSALDSWSYLRLIDLLGKGYGLLSKEELYAVCRVFWLKPHHEEKKFKLIFDSYIDALIARLNAPPVSDTPQPADPEPAKDDTDNNNLKNTGKQKEPETPPESPETKAASGQTTEQEAYETVTLSFQQAETPTQFLNTDNENWKKEIFAKPYRLQGKYLSVHPRRIQQSIRSLRMLTRGKGKEAIDWSATIDKISKQGYLDELLFKNVPVISTEAKLLIDIDGSMIAFQQLTDEIVRSVQQSKKKKHQVYYFRNCPIRFLYRDKDLTQALPVQLFKRKNKLPLFIISDAGAARGRYDKKRIELTKAFLEGLDLSSVVWLNPMPRNRWRGSSAEYIANMVHMFEISDHEFGNAVKLFKTGR